MKLFLSLSSCILFLWANSPLFGDFQELKKEFLENNKDLKLLAFEVQKEALEEQMLWAKRPFMLEATLLKDQQELQVISPLMQRAKEQMGGQLALSKRFSFGGTFRVGQSLYQEDLPLATTTGLPAEHYALTSFISYQQNLGPDFFGREFRTQVQSAILKKELKELEREMTLETRLFQFYGLYLNAVLYKSLITLQNEAIEKAQKRHQLIEQRVHDGLLGQIDLLTSKTALLSTQEEKDLLSLELQEALYKLTKTLQRQVKESEISLLQTLPDTDGRDLFEQKESKPLSFLKKRLTLQSTLLQKNSYSFTPDLQLQTTYATNSYDKSLSSGYKRGFFGNPRSQWLISLQMNWPLDFESAKTEEAQLNIEKKKQEFDLLQTETSFNEERKSLHDELEKMKTLLQKAKIRESIALENLALAQKLYISGKKDLDSVLRAEEGPILAKKAIVQYKIRGRLLMANLLLLNGTFEDFSGHTLRLSLFK